MARSGRMMRKIRRRHRICGSTVYIGHCQCLVSPILTVGHHLVQKNISAESGGNYPQQILSEILMQMERLNSYFTQEKQGDSKASAHVEMSCIIFHAGMKRSNCQMWSYPTSIPVHTTISSPFRACQSFKYQLRQILHGRVSSGSASFSKTSQV